MITPECRGLALVMVGLVGHFKLKNVESARVGLVTTHAQQFARTNGGNTFDIGRREADDLSVG